MTFGESLLWVVLICLGLVVLALIVFACVAVAPIALPLLAVAALVWVVTNPQALIVIAAVLALMLIIALATTADAREAEPPPSVKSQLNLPRDGRGRFITRKDTP